MRYSFGLTATNQPRFYNRHLAPFTIFDYIKKVGRVKDVNPTYIIVVMSFFLEIGLKNILIDLVNFVKRKNFLPTFPTFPTFQV